MSGHSKWENIKRKKGKTDAIRAENYHKNFQGNHDCCPYGRRRSCRKYAFKIGFDKAKQNNVPKDNIQRLLPKV